jgi:hypothetical protein
LSHALIKTINENSQQNLPAPGANQVRKYRLLKEVMGFGISQVAFVFN